MNSFASGPYYISAVENFAVIYSPTRDMASFTLQPEERFNYVISDNTKKLFIFENKPVNHSQKPIGLLQTLIARHSHSNELILDLFSGSGSTACAALNLSRNVLSFELDSFQTSAISSRILSLTPIDDSLLDFPEEIITNFSTNICCVCLKGPQEDLLICPGCYKLGHWQCNIMIDDPYFTENEKEEAFFDTEKCFKIFNKSEE